MGVRMSGFAEAARSLEEAGFESIWIPEHLAMPAEITAIYPYADSGVLPVGAGTPCYNPLVLLSYFGLRDIDHPTGQ